MHDVLHASAGIHALDAGAVVCVVLNWNGWRDTLRCLDSLAAQDDPGLDVVVVDNASTDDSVARLTQALGPRVELVQSAQNGGFASGCNIGIRLALDRGAQFVWLLNNDTIAPPDTLRKLVAGMTQPHVGMVGTVLRYAHDPATVQAWGGGSIVRWLGFNRHFVRATAMDRNSYLTFASVLIRTELLRSVGLLDEGFFMYFEDADLSFRARQAGWQLHVAAATAVLHREGGSGDQRRSTRSDRTITTSGLRFLARHGRPAGVAQVLFVLSRVARRVFAGELHGALAVLSGTAAWWQTRAERNVQGGPA